MSAARSSCTDWCCCALHGPCTLHAIAAAVAAAATFDYLGMPPELLDDATAATAFQSTKFGADIQNQAGRFFVEHSVLKRRAC
eukprot:4348-Heterococcus_DN1.PRE.1